MREAPLAAVSRNSRKLAVLQVDVGAVIETLTVAGLPVLPEALPRVSLPFIPLHPLFLHRMTYTVYVPEPVTYKLSVTVPATGATMLEDEYQQAEAPLPRDLLAGPVPAVVFACNGLPPGQSAGACGPERAVFEKNHCWVVA